MIKRRHQTCFLFYPETVAMGDASGIPTRQTPGITGRHGNDTKKGNGVVMVTNPERRLNPCLAVWLPPSPRLQTGLGQTAGGAEEKPGHEIYTSLPLTSAPDQRPRQNNHVLKPQVSEHECLGPKPAE
ncbi:hypothetical protein D4764_18G0009620 [Takifugu flavidus]|uniref:Uncharacterized protein n=1 Tax=Takifugu flavidus TaxID=433684 RepID=A0A5C6NT37_9TELE|nr:hypothetical protein D4764_18G0009620 [Takifugu flavidus]